MMNDERLSCGAVVQCWWDARLRKLIDQESVEVLHSSGHQVVEDFVDYLNYLRLDLLDDRLARRLVVEDRLQDGDCGEKRETRNRIKNQTW
jgi:hypothetical protein